jgi:hypothetical protein
MLPSIGLPTGRVIRWHGIVTGEQHALCARLTRN